MIVSSCLATQLKECSYLRRAGVASSVLFAGAFQQGRHRHRGDDLAVTWIPETMRVCTHGCGTLRRFVGRLSAVIRGC